MIGKQSLSLVWVRCLIADFDGALFAREWKDALWDKFFMVEPREFARSTKLRCGRLSTRRPQRRVGFRVERGYPPSH